MRRPHLGDAVSGQAAARLRRSAGGPETHSEIDARKRGKERLALPSTVVSGSQADLHVRCMSATGSQLVMHWTLTGTLAAITFVLGNLPYSGPLRTPGLTGGFRGRFRGNQVSFDGRGRVLCTRFEFWGIISSTLSHPPIRSHRPADAAFHCASALLIPRRLSAW